MGDPSSLNVSQIITPNLRQSLSNYELYYMNNTSLESLIMVLISASTNFVSFPVVVMCYRRGYLFHALIFLMSIMCSFLYHFGEIFNCVVYLKYHEWHRLDNIFAIASFGLYGLYITGNKDEQLYTYLTLLVAILSQEKDPWNINYTLVPIVSFFVLGIAHNLYYKKSLPAYDSNMVLKGSLVMLVALVFFSKGLNEETDYLRFNHGMWHALVGVASWFNFHSIKQPTYTYSPTRMQSE